MNSIIDLLDLEDPNVSVTEVITEGNVKTVVLESRPVHHYCPECGFRMHSKGIHKRIINHPLLQDVYSLKILLKQRRWKCTNPSCGYAINESFPFVSKYRRNTNATDMLIVEAFKDLSHTAADIADRFHVSDSHAIRTFDSYVKMDRLPLSDAICVDEVYIDMDRHCKYALVIQDFHTGDPIDLLISRRNEITEPYFANIPIEERLNVKYLVSDMYNEYIRYVDRYFPNAISVVDSFHVMQWILREIDKYLKHLMSMYKQRDEERQNRLSNARGYAVNLPVSDEVYLLKKYRWLILKNQSSINYRIDTHLDFHFKYMMNTYAYELKLLDINPRIRLLRDWKEEYVTFNERNAGNPERAKVELEELIDRYLNSNDSIITDFGLLLSRFKQQIINSFIMLERTGPKGTYESRLSNGPMESLNRKVKDLKRIGRGYSNFDHFRNRFLYAARYSPVINGSSDPEHTYEYIIDEDII